MQVRIASQALNTEEDVTGGGSNRLVDDIVAWGDLDLVTSRIRAHFEAAIGLPGAGCPHNPPAGHVDEEQDVEPL